MSLSLLLLQSSGVRMGFSWYDSIATAGIQTSDDTVKGKRKDVFLGTGIEVFLVLCSYFIIGWF